MQQYIVYAWDDTDDQALQRRMDSRPAHFVNARRMKENGKFVFGGAILDDEGKMIGSMMVVQFNTPEELELWMQTEPYITGQVWQKTDIRPFRTADV